MKKPDEVTTPIPESMTAAMDVACHRPGGANAIPNMAVAMAMVGMYMRNQGHSSVAGT